MLIDGTAAARTLQTYAPLAYRGACLYYVWRAYDAHGADTKLQAQTALQAWNLSEGKHRGDRNPPPGVPVWFGRRTSDGNMAGDVVISLGGGRVVATDQPTWGKVGTTTIAGRQALIGREYLGWSECIFDAPIAVPAPAGTDEKPLPKPAQRKDRKMTVNIAYIPAGDKGGNAKKNVWIQYAPGFYHEFTGDTAGKQLAEQAGGAAAKVSRVWADGVRKALGIPQAVEIVNADEIGTTVNVNAG
nr:hypothetical protein [Microbacterium bovistercoris]